MDDAEFNNWLHQSADAFANHVAEMQKIVKSPELDAKFTQEENAAQTQALQALSQCAVDLKEGHSACDVQDHLIKS